MSDAPLARILIVDDEAASVRALCDTLPEHGYEAVGFGSGEQALSALERDAFDIVLTDLMMPGMDGVELLSRCLEIDPQLVGIVMTGAGTIETAVQAMKAGALDYVLKPIRMGVLLPVLSRAASVRRLRLENLELRSTVAIHELTQAMAHTLDPNVLLDRIADAAMAQFDADETSVMLLDDSGGFLSVAAVRGKGREWLLGQRTAFNRGIAGWVAAQREPVVLQREVTDPRFESLHPRPEIQSALSMPMVTRNKLIGVLNVNCLERRNAFSLGKIKVLSVFTNAAAAGIEAARLYESQRRLDTRYREILQMAADGIVSVDEQRRIVLFNAGAEAIFGYEQREVIGKPLDVLLPVDLVQPFLAAGESDRAQDDPSPLAPRRRALLARRKDGAQIHIEVGVSSRRENGLALCTAVVRDVTERVRREHRIADLTRIMAVLGRIGSAIVRIRDRRELYQEACRIAVEDGGAGVAWIGAVDPLHQLVTPVASAGLAPGCTAALRPVSFAAELPDARCLVHRAVRERTIAYCNDLAQLPEAVGLRRSDALRRGLNSVVVLPLLVQDVVVAVLALLLPSLELMDDDEGMHLYGQMATDLSFGLEHIESMEELHATKQALEQERERLAERVAERTVALTRSNLELVRAREEADQANRAKSAFLASMSHEIRTPMNGVLGMLEVLAHESLTDQQRDMVRTVRQSATSLLGIIDDILDFSKIEAGRLEIELAPVRLGDLVEAICASMLPVAWNSGIDLRLFVAPDVPHVVRSDEVRLRQLLFNLLGNAIKFSRGTGRRGRVSVLVTVLDRSPLRLRLRVEDNGIGMDPDTLERIFQPFMQGEASTTRRFGGTGLGLAICKRVATRMEGDIAVTSVHGQGSVFDIVLPFEVVAADASHSLPDLAGLRCTLVISPDIDAADLRAYLEDAGAQVAMVPADAAPSTRLACAEQSVIIRDAGRDCTSSIDDAASAATPPQPPHARQRRRLRIEGRRTLTLDRDALRRQVLLQSVARAAGRCTPEASGSGEAAALVARRMAPLPVEQARALGRLILVVEDDAVNQKVVMQQLALLGHTAQVAKNGKEALRMWRTGGYGLLLTDLHMPEMDGYALVEAIREEESGRERIPIIALSANALRGEANRALASGMEQYLTKPVELKVLREALERWLGGTGFAAADSTITLPTKAADPAIFDGRVLEGLVGGDPRVVRELLSDYLRSCAQHAASLRSAYSNGDAAALAAVAHKLKSSSRSAGALAMGELCAALEAAGNADDGARVTDLVAGFDAIYLATEERISRALLDAR